MSSEANLPLVSVVVPCYNNGDTILAAIASIFSQSYKRVEAIIVNDGSTDHTDDAIKQYISIKGVDITYIVIPNAGPSNARNIGIDNAIGEFIAFLDGDDCWESTKLEKQMQYFTNYSDTALVGCAFGKRRIASNVIAKFINFKELLLTNYFSTPTVVIKKKCLEELNLKFNTAQRYSEDYRLWLEISRHFRVLLLNEVLAKNQLDKADYGETGLSSNLYLMEKGELSNYDYLLKKGYITKLTYLLASSYSVLKYLVRLLKSSIRSFRS
jgi:glycosyltransferase involved in cell wall biosynthesis